MSHGTLNLSVGCICSGHMEGDEDGEQSIELALQRARARQRTLTNRTAKRNKFPDLTSWTISKKGNLTINKDGTWVTIIKSRYNRFAAMVGSERVGGWEESEREAKLNAFDHLYPARIQQ